MLRSCALALLSVAAGVLSPRAAEAQQPVAGAAGNAAEVQKINDEVATLRKEFEQLRRQYDDRLGALEQRLQQLGQPATPAAVTAVQTPEPAAVPLQGGQPPTGAMAPATGRSAFNPDISVIGNVLGVAGNNEYTEQPAIELTEAELAFQAAVDPYARGDFYLAAGPEGVEVEEAYATFTALPGNFLVKAGKLRAQFGKVNTLHTHGLPTADRPLVTENLLGGEEGLSDSGVSVSRIFNNPHVYLEATGEIYAGRSEVFHSTDRAHLTYLGRFRAYRDLTEDKNLDLGVSYAFGKTDPDLMGASSGAGDMNKRLIGFDATFRYRPLQRALYTRLNLRTELIWSRQDLPDLSASSAFGFYGLGEYQFARRWYIGGRVDRSGRAPDASLVDKGGSVFVTFWPTEFSQLRGQYRHTSYAEGVTAHEGLFQLNFSIGAHGAHVF
jgi:hypothetical protein